VKKAGTNCVCQCMRTHRHARAHARKRFNRNPLNGDLLAIYLAQGHSEIAIPLVPFQQDSEVCPLSIMTDCGMGNGVQSQQ
jgi:hypothetical protein